jgi:hypothetical protein
MIHRSFATVLGPLAASAIASAGCAAAAPPDTLPRLREAISSPVSTPADNAEHSRLAELASRDKLLQGMTREQVEDTLGKGEPCAQHELCGKKGFDPRDLIYEIGTAGSYVRYRPALIVGFDDWGKVARTYVLEVR